MDGDLRHENRHLKAVSLRRLLLEHRRNNTICLRRGVGILVNGRRTVPAV
jgi:hypothetical protein